MQRDQNGADIPDKPLFVRTLGIVDSYPAGCPIPYPGLTAPDGYLLMDGRAFSKTLYPQLANLYPDGKLPDMRGMYVRGWDNRRGLDIARLFRFNNTFGTTVNTDKEIMGGITLGDIRNTSALNWSGFSTGEVTPRGYEIKCEQFYSDDFRFREKQRVLLSTQYYEYLMNDFTGSLNQIYEYYSNDFHQFERNEEPYFNIKRPTGKINTLEDIKKIAAKEVKLVRKKNTKSEFTVSADARSGKWNEPTLEEITDFNPEGLKAKRLAPVGVPNVAFNYITKAA